MHIRSGPLTAALAAVILIAPNGIAGAQTAADSALAKVAEIQDRLAGVDETIGVLNTDVANLKKLKVSGYIQARYERHYDTMSRADSSGTTLNKDDFYIRRGRLKFTYTPGTTSQYVIYFDANRATVSLKEAYVKLTEPWTRKGLSLTVGQQNVPFGYELERSSSVRELPERSRAENTLFPGERDRGAKLIVPVDPRVTLTAGVWNGPGINDRVGGVVFAGRDPDNRKDVTGRAAVSLGWLDFGGSLYAGSIQGPVKKDGAKTIPPRQYTKNRYGADAQLYYEVPGLGGGSLKGEGYWARDVIFYDKTKAANNAKEPLRIHQLGWYGMLVQNLGEDFQLAARIDRFDPDKDTEDDATTTWTAGLNYFWDGNTRITLAYDHPVFEKDDDKLPKDDFVTVQFQLVY